MAGLRRRGGPTTGQITFPDGEEFAEVVIPAPENSTQDGLKEVALTLLTAQPGSTPYAIDQPAPDTLVVFDNEPQETVWVDSTQNAVEGTSAGYVRLRRGDTSASLTVPYALNAQGTTATSGVDFAELGGSVTFAIGQETADVVIDPTGPYADELTEGTEYAQLEFFPGEDEAFTAMPVALLDAAPGNQPPEFTPRGADGLRVLHR